YLPGTAAHPEHAQIIHSVDGALFPVSAVPSGTLTNADRGADWTTEPVAGYAGLEDDDELIAHMLAARDVAEDKFAPPGTPPRFGALWYADAAPLSVKFPPIEPHQVFDHTRADAALANELVYYCGGNCERALRILERGALAQRDSYREDKGRR